MGIGLPEIQIFQFRVEIERSGRLDGEAGDRLVEDAVVFGLAEQKESLNVIRAMALG